MFTKPLEYIFLPSALREAYDEINKRSSGLDDVDFGAFEEDFTDNIEDLSRRVIDGSYAPEPLREIEIDKPHSDEKRPIGIGAIKDKIVQRVLYDNLEPYYDKTFSDKSYAYRPGKSTLRAINRTTQFLNDKRLHIVKTDIDDFFENIDHDILLGILDREIRDRRITRLISLFVQTGGFHDLDYDEHEHGVHQGDILSPLLSNIYLDRMDKYLESRDISFVRYADDFVMFFKSRGEAWDSLRELKGYLRTLGLSLQRDKTEVAHIRDGFSFLGVHFEGRNRSVENERLQHSISRLHTLAKDKSGFALYVEELDSYLTALKNYYLKLITKNTAQYAMFQAALIESVAHKIYLSRASKSVKAKKVFRNFLSQIDFEILFDPREADDKRELALAKGYEKYLANKSYKAPKTKIEKKKKQYARKFADESTLHIQTYGMMLGVSKNKFVLKRYGRVVQKYPFDRVKRIIFEGKGFSISSDLLKKCADNAITVDFIDTKAFAYASLVTYRSTLSQNIQKQALLLHTPRQLELARAFIRGKAKNQVNYLKYLDKYHKLLDVPIEEISRNLVKIKSAPSVEALMGIEGSISASYWEGLRLVLDVPFEKRITQGARDLVNSSLNYGYAILYGKVQHSLVYAGLSLHISFLHSIDGSKPTLTFDMIEEFRTFVVDRVIISMLNKDEPIRLGRDGLLTKPSRRLIAKNIKEKLGSYTMWKKESRKVENIIQIQCYRLAKVIEGTEKKYKPFIGKF